MSIFRSLSLIATSTSSASGSTATVAALVWIRPPLSVTGTRSEEHTSELQSLMRISYAVFCLKKKKTQDKQQYSHHNSTTINLHASTNYTTTTQSPTQTKH